MTALIVAFLLQACAKEHDYTAAARECVSQETGGRKISTAPERDVVARRCNAAIKHWAIESTRRAYGVAFDANDVEVREEYRDRKLAILSVLMPIEGDPGRM